MSRHTGVRIFVLFLASLLSTGVLADTVERRFPRREIARIEERFPVVQEDVDRHVEVVLQSTLDLAVDANDAEHRCSNTRPGSGDSGD